MKCAKCGSEKGLFNKIREWECGDCGYMVSESELCKYIKKVEAVIKEIKEAISMQIDYGENGMENADDYQIIEKIEEILSRHKEKGVG